MSELYLPLTRERSIEFPVIQNYLAERGVSFKRWSAAHEYSEDASPEVIMEAYKHELVPVMKAQGFTTSDIIMVHPTQRELIKIRNKFIKEHTHSEDEARFFLDGEGAFWMHFESGEVVRLICERGDFLSVPRGLRHWFDIAPKYHVKAIRLFTDPSGWVAQYTGSGVEERFL